MKEKVCNNCYTRISTNKNNCPICGNGQMKTNSEINWEFIDKLKTGYYSMNEETKKVFKKKINYKAKPKEKIICNICHKEIDSKYKWKIQINYGSKGYDSLDSCRDCVIEKFNFPIERVLFKELLVNFKFEFKLGPYDKWNNEQLELFSDILKQKNIPIQDYNIPIYELNDKIPIGLTSYYLHKLL